MPLTHSPEARLVFRSADPRCADAELARLAADVTDWERCVLLAEHELATASLWRALRDAGAELPAPVAEHLRRTAMFGDFRMQQLALRLQETVAAFAALGVPVVLLKGAALGALVDPTFRLRPMTDIDLLARPDDLARARAALVQAGWDETADPALRELLGSDHHHLPPFLDPRLPGLRVELHRSIFPSDHSFAFDESHLLRDARPAPAPFAGALVPSLEHLLLHACIHFAWQHSMHFGAWRTFRLAGAVVGARDFSWERFAATAHVAKAATSCYWTLRLAQRMSGLEVPVDVLERLAPPTAEFLRAALERHFIAALVPDEAPMSPSLGMSRLLWRLALRPRWSGHRAPRRWESDLEWRRVRMGDLPEPALARVRRHAAGARAWWEFLSTTLLGR
jgi:hypothetical protein